VLHKAKEAREPCLGSSILVNEGVAFRSVAGEGVLFRVDTAEYFGLDPVGSRIWLLLEQKKTLPDVLEELRREYECGEQQCRDDLLRFVRGLAEHGLVAVDEEPDQASFSQE
jgi:hypothetical protein